MIKQIHKKEDAFPGPNNQQAPDITLVLADHSFISVVDKVPAIYQRPEIEGTHYPIGILLAGGPGIKPGATIPARDIADVTPCMLYSLGLPLPSDFEGQLATDLFTDDCLATDPPRTGDPTILLDPDALDGAPGMEAEEEDQIFKQLQALGYVE